MHAFCGARTLSTSRQKMRLGAKKNRTSDERCTKSKCKCCPGIVSHPTMQTTHTTQARSFLQALSSSLRVPVEPDQACETHRQAAPCLPSFLPSCSSTPAQAASQQGRPSYTPYNHEHPATTTAADAACSSTEHFLRRCHSDVAKHVSRARVECRGLG